MPIIDSSLNKFIDDELIRENAKREAEHESSGLLSASMLFQPLRFQVLKTLKAPRRPFDAYTLAKFKRGRDVEDWYVDQLEKSGFLVTNPNILSEHNLKTSDDTQPKGSYKKAICYIDAVIDTDKMQAKVGIIPNEVKSITNMKWRRIKKTGIDWHYKMQACFAGLAMGTTHYAVTIVSAEDYRSETHIFRTRHLKADVDRAIDNYMAAMKNWKKNRTLPVFEPHAEVKWVSNPKYAMFTQEWMNEPDSWAIGKMEELGII